MTKDVSQDEEDMTCLKELAEIGFDLIDEEARECCVCVLCMGVFDNHLCTLVLAFAFVRHRWHCSFFFVVFVFIFCRSCLCIIGS